MAEFDEPYTNLSLKDSFSKNQMIKAIRQNIEEKNKSINLYMQLAESINYELAVISLNEIADSVMMHIGELLRLIKYLELNEY